MKEFIKGVLVVCTILIIINNLNFNKNKEVINELYKTEKMLFAHRGLSEFAENSWQGFKQSKNIGINSFECDVQCTKDEKLIIFHDKNAKRLLGIDRNIEDLLWTDIQSKTIIHNNLVTDQYILSLDEILRLSSNFKYIYLDFKKTNKTIADRLLVLMKKYNTYEHVLVGDANILFLAYLKYKIPQIKTVWEGFNKGKEWSYFLVPSSLKPDYFASFFSEVDDKHIQFLNEQNLMHRKIVYDINKNNFQQAVEAGLKHLIVDYDSSLSSQIADY